MRQGPEFYSCRQAARQADDRTGGRTVHWSDFRPVVLVCKIIGDAARTGRYDLQDLKRVWHCLARFGVRTTC